MCHAESARDEHAGSAHQVGNEQKFRSLGLRERCSQAIETVTTKVDLALYALFALCAFSACKVAFYAHCEVRQWKDEMDPPSPREGKDGCSCRCTPAKDNGQQEGRAHDGLHSCAEGVDLPDTLSGWPNAMHAVVPHVVGAVWIEAVIGPGGRQWHAARAHQLRHRLHIPHPPRGPQHVQQPRLVELVRRALAKERVKRSVGRTRCAARRLLHPHVSTSRPQPLAQARQRAEGGGEREDDQPHRRAGDGRPRLGARLDDKAHV
eukprot:scaffold124871_cov25-Tisochrysis_lutea.AAC.1